MVSKGRKDILRATAEKESRKMEARPVRKELEEIECIQRTLLLVLQAGRQRQMNLPQLFQVSLVCNTNLLLDIDAPVSRQEMIP